MKKDEHARKRKELTKRKVQEEKTAALNRLVRQIIPELKFRVLILTKTPAQTPSIQSERSSPQARDTGCCCCRCRRGGRSRLSLGRRGPAPTGQPCVHQMGQHSGWAQIRRARGVVGHENRCLFRTPIARKQCSPSPGDGVKALRDRISVLSKFTIKICRWGILICKIQRADDSKGAGFERRNKQTNMELDTRIAERNRPR